MSTSDFTYVYRLRSINHPEQVYTGCTTDREQRLKDHNRDHVVHTSKFAPWQIEVASVDMAWDLANGTFTATLTSQTDQRIRQQLPEAVGKARFEPATAEPQEVAAGGWDVNLCAGQSLRGYGDVCPLDQSTRSKGGS